jgi:tRNA-2-methylthio-N6-dimethylallyladenosine synthase
MGIPYYIETYGCQMNEYDSLVAQSILNTENYRVNTPDEAQLVLLNTCSIRENAHQKIFNRLKALERLHKKGTRIAIIGCMAQSFGKELFNSDLPVDFLIGPDELRNLGNLSEKEAHVETSKTETYEDIIPSIDLHVGIKKETLSANVAIQRGCNNFCTFCVVPYTRGRERSRPVDSIITEIQSLTDCGVHTIVLLGQNVNSYKFENTTFTDLVKTILDKTNVKRLYYTSPHPLDFPESIIDLTRSEPRLGTQIHIPVQSGSNEVLSRMKRDYTREEFIRLVNSFKEKVEDVSISTDIIVGFPGETLEQFAETLDIMDNCQFDFAFMFAYSEREHTFARKNYPDDISADEKSQRLSKVIAKQLEISENINRKYIGKIIPAYVESISKKDKFEIIATTKNLKKIVAPIPEGQTFESLMGKEKNIKVESAGSQTLRGIIEL